MSRDDAPSPEYVTVRVLDAIRSELQDLRLLLTERVVPPKPVAIKAFTYIGREQFRVQVRPDRIATLFYTEAFRYDRHDDLDSSQVTITTVAGYELKFRIWFVDLAPLLRQLGWEP